jgi:hypothetical protein
MVVNDAFASSMEIVFCERVTRMLIKREAKFREELTGRFEVRKQKEERYMNQELDKLKKTYKDQDLDHSKKCLKAVKNLKTHEEEMSIHVSIKDNGNGLVWRRTAELDSMVWAYSRCSLILIFIRTKLRLRPGS